MCFKKSINYLLLFGYRTQFVCDECDDAHQNSENVPIVWELSKTSKTTVQLTRAVGKLREGVTPIGYQHPLSRERKPLINREIKQTST